MSLTAQDVYCFGVKRGNHQNQMTSHDICGYVEQLRAYVDCNYHHKAA